MVGQPPDVDHILNRLADDQPNIRREAARCLSAFGASSEKLVQGYLNALRTSERRDRDRLVVAIWSLQSLGAHVAVDTLEKLAANPEVDKHARTAAAFAAVALKGGHVDAVSQRSEMPEGIAPSIGGEVIAAQLIFQQAPETWDYFNPLNLPYAVELPKRGGGFVAEYRPGGVYPDLEDPIWTMGGSDGFGNVWPSSPYTAITPLPTTADQQANAAADPSGHH